MNKIKKILLLLLFSSLIFVNGCDELSNLKVNVPLIVNFSTSGSNTQLTESESFCLSDYADWRENQEDVNSATYVSAAYWTESTSPGLQGDVTVTLSDQFGNLLFSYTIDNYNAAANIDTAYTLELDETQIQAIDTYLSVIGSQQNDLCFQASLTVSNITGTSTPYQLSGRVEVVIEADTEL
jgi:hypothetical protein